MDMRLPSCKITGTVLAALVLATFGLANADRADAAPSQQARVHIVEQADHTVRRLHVVYAERVGRYHRNLYFEYNDGTAGYATPCRLEDSTWCWWDGQRRGDDRGHSVLNFGEGVHLTVRNSLLNRGLAGRVAVSMSSDRYGEWSMPNGEHGQYVTGGWS